MKFQQDCSGNETLDLLGVKMQATVNCFSMQLKNSGKYYRVRINHSQSAVNIHTLYERFVK